MSEAKIELTAFDKTKAAFDSAKKGLGELQTKAVAVTGVLAGLGVTAFVAKMGDDILRTLEQWDELGKAAQRAGFQSAQGMAEFQFSAKLAGLEASNFEGAVAKLNTKMADAAGGSKEAAAIFDAMGVKIKDTTGHLRNTEDVLTELADKFAGYKDGPEKAALATELFGKAGREMIPLLNGGAEGLQRTREEFRKLRGEISPELVKQAEQFNDNITRLEANMGNLSRTMAEKMARSLAQITDAMVEQAKRGGTLLAVWAGISEFWKIATGGDALGQASSRAATADDRMSRLGDQISQQVQLLQRDPNDSASARRLGTLRKQLEQVQREALAASDAVKQVLDPSLAAKSTGDFARMDRQAAPTTAPIVKKPGAGGTGDEFTSIMNRVRERLAAQTAELEKGRALTEQEKFEIKVTDDLANAKVKLTASQRAKVEATLKESSATQASLERRAKQLAMDKAIVEDQLQTQNEQLAAEAESGKSRDQYRLALLAETNALADLQQQLDLEGRMIGATDAKRQIALEHLRIELKLRQDLDALDRNLNFDESQRDEERARLRANAAIAKAQVSQRTDQDATKEFSDGLRSDMRGALTRAFEDSKNPARAFIEGFASTLYSRVSAKLADAILDAVMPSGGGAARGLLGALGGSLGSSFQASFSQTSLGASGFGTGLAYGNMDIGAFLHAGGIAGDEYTFKRPVDPTVFRRAPRYHTGGVAGDEVPAVLKRGEGVFTPGQMKALGDGGAMKLTIINNTRTPIGNVTEQRISSRERALIIEEAKASFAGAMGDANSRESRAISRNFNVRKRR